MLTAINIILALAVIGGVCYVSYRSSQLDELEEDLREERDELEGRMNKLAADEETCRMLNMQLRDELHKMRPDNTKIMVAQYAVSESDMMKYKDDKAVERAMRKQLATGIAREIMKLYPEPERVDGNPGPIYRYRFRVSPCDNTDTQVHTPPRQEP